MPDNFDFPSYNDVPVATTLTKEDKEKVVESFNNVLSELLALKDRFKSPADKFSRAEVSVLIKQVLLAKSEFNKAF